ncbi:hypothetical protein CEF21_03510 [Bacillus sp. FJAT-42376]|uniref:hypothetical protein n=1 Tax=Bacillus sp. FJAT-42376 TaxID=2014076 RepID=UPI000F4F7485|nr:hypothetical protein [Bacillus sp. FJAT-42376]AZB41443.1 hypothetical protein CEF21_03510 [Bacillus sp. FJAT-42376]
MDTQLSISIVILTAIAEAAGVFLFVQYKRGNIEGNPFLALLKKEWLVLFYAFFRWKRGRKDTESSARSFFYHKGSLYTGLFIALLHEQVIEAIVFHIYLKEEEPIKADILLALHVYSILYMLGDYNLVRNSPIQIVHNKVRMVIGARRSLSFHLKDVETIQPAKIKYHKNGGMVHEKNVFHASVLPRVLTKIFGVTDELKYEIVFKEPVLSRGYFGQQKPVAKAWVYMDQPEPFIEALKAEIENLEDNAGDIHCVKVLPT